MKNLKWKRMELNTIIRTVTLIGLVILLGILAYAWYIVENSVETIEIQDIGLQYDWEENLTWKTGIISNPVIDAAYLNEDDFLHKAFTRSIKISFEVPLTSDVPLTFEGTTLFKAGLVSVYGEQKELLWEINDVYELEEVVLEGDRLVFAVEREMPIMAHKGFIQEVTEQYTMAGNYLYVFEYAIEGTVTDGVTVSDFTIRPKAEFPIVDVVSKGLKTVSAVDATEFKDISTRIVEEPGDKSMLAFIWFGMGVVGLLLILTAVFTRNKASKDEFDRFVDGFIREHSDRMVTIPKSLSLNYGNVMRVEEPEDMIKAADEINQPIFSYYINDEGMRKFEMFIFDDVRVYYYAKLGVIKGDAV